MKTDSFLFITYLAGFSETPDKTADEIYNSFVAFCNEHIPDAITSKYHAQLLIIYIDAIDFRKINITFNDAIELFVNRNVAFAKDSKLLKLIEQHTS